MAFNRDAQRLRSLKHPLTLRQRKTNAFTEQINGLKQPLFPQLRQNGLAHQRNIAVRIIPEFRWRRMRSQQRRADFNDILCRQRCHHAQYFLFCRQIQAVAGFYFQQRNTFFDQLFHPLMGYV